MAKKPEDHKSKVPASYTIDTGDAKIKVSLKLKFRHILRIIDLTEMSGEMSALSYLVESALPPEISEVLLDVDDEIVIPQLMGLMEALGERLGASMGESDGSSGSETSTEEP